MEHRPMTEEQRVIRAGESRLGGSATRLASRTPAKEAESGGWIES